MKVIYVAGPYRAATPWGVESNIYRAREAGAAIAQLGAMPLIPHANTAHYDGLQPDKFWIEGTLELLRRCDAVYLLPGWVRSQGTLGEVAEAIIRKIPLFDTLDQMRAWL